MLRCGRIALVEKTKIKVCPCKVVRDPLKVIENFTGSNPLLEIQRKGTGIWGLLPLLTNNLLHPRQGQVRVTWRYLQREFETTSATVSDRTFPLAVNKQYQSKQDHQNYQKVVLGP